MLVRRNRARLTLELVVFGWAALALTSCSQDETLVADPGASPFYPATADPKKAATEPAATEKGKVPSGARVAQEDAPLPNVAGDKPIDARFGTNEVERQLRVALRTAQKGDRAGAAELLDKVLTVEPINREALHGRALIYLDDARHATSPDEKEAFIDKAVELIGALRRAYDSPKPHEKELISRVLYTRFKALADRGNFDQAVAALKTACETGIDGFARVDLDESLAKLRATPQYKLAKKADYDQRLALARERVSGRLGPPPVVPFDFKLTDLNGKKVSLADFKGKVVLADFWGTWCGPCREAMPFLIGLYYRQHDHGLEVVGLNYERDATSQSEHREMAKKYVDATKIPYPNLIGDEATVKQVPGFKGFPTSVLIDRAGRVRLLVIENDAQTPELLNDAVRVLLAEPAPTNEPVAKASAAKEPAAKEPAQKKP
jgi:thiol-disulfide isomerase/thioredoxin